MVVISRQTQAAALGFVVLGAAKCTLGCSSRTCKETVRGDIGLSLYRVILIRPSGQRKCW